MQDARTAGVHRTIASVLAGLLAAMIPAAAGADDASPLEECYSTAYTRLDVAPCLVDMLDVAGDAMAVAVAHARAGMVSLDAVTGRGQALPAFEASQHAFHAYRDAQCGWVYQSMSPGTGAGDAKLDCLVRLIRTRTAALNTISPDRNGAPLEFQHRHDRHRKNR